MALSALTLTILIALGIVALLVSLWLAFRKPRPTTLDYKLLSIEIPQDEESKEKDLIKEMALSEQLMNSLLAMGSPFVFESAVHHVGEEIHFYVSVPGDRSEFVARQIQGLYLKFRVREVPDYTI